MRQDLELAVEAARTAGQILLSFYQSEYEIQSKGQGNPLTEADLAADQALKERLTAARPDYGWLSEETADSQERLERKRVWIVDPLDGTKEFIQGVPHFTVSIGLVEGGRAIAGVIYNPVKDEMFSGLVGEGAWFNGQPARASDRSVLEGALILASRSEMRRGEFAPFEEDFRLEAVGSIAYKLALVAVGRGDVSFSMGPKHEWDVCAGAALVEAAGGRAGTRDGSPLVFNRPRTLTDGILVSGAGIFDAMAGRCRPLLDQYAHRFTERNGQGC